MKLHRLIPTSALPLLLVVLGLAYAGAQQEPSLLPTPPVLDALPTQPPPLEAPETPPDTAGAAEDTAGPDEITTAPEDPTVAEELEEAEGAEEAEIVIPETLPESAYPGSVGDADGAPDDADDPIAPPAPDPAPATPFDPDALEADPQFRQIYTAPSSLVRGRPLVAVWMNGVGPYAFLLDTALRRPIVALEVAEYLGLSGSMSYLETEDHAGNPFVATAVLIESFTFAGMPDHAETAAIMDLSPLSARLGTRIAGILPAYQPGFEVSIDFESPSVTWRPLSEAQLQGPDSHTALTAIGSAGAPRVNVRVNGGESIPMVVDLNLPSAVALPEDLLYAWNALDDMTPRLMTVASAWQGDTQIRLDSIQTAGAQLRRPICRVLPAEEQARLGLDFLRHFRVTLNYEFGLLRLERPGNTVLEAAPLVGYGVSLAHVAFGYWQLHVANNSSAFEAGLRSGDYIVGINDQPVNIGYWADSGYQFISRLLRAEEGDTIALHTMRDGVPFQSYLMAQPLLP